MASLSAVYLHSIGIIVPANVDVRRGNNIETIRFLFGIRVMAADRLREALELGHYGDFYFPSPDEYTTAEEWFDAYKSDDTHNASSIIWRNGSVWELIALALLLNVTVDVHRYEQDAHSEIWTPSGSGHEQGRGLDGTGGPTVNIAQQFRPLFDENYQPILDRNGNPSYETFHFEVMLPTELAQQRRQQHQQQPHQPTDQQLQEPQQDLEPHEQQQQKKQKTTQGDQIKVYMCGKCKKETKNSRLRPTQLSCICGKGRDSNWLLCQGEPEEGQIKVYMCGNCNTVKKDSKALKPQLRCPCGIGKHYNWLLCPGETEVTFSTKRVKNQDASVVDCRGIFYTSQDFYPPYDPSDTTAAMEDVASFGPGDIPWYIPQQEHSSYVEGVEAAKKRIPAWKFSPDAVVTHAILIFVSKMDQVGEAFMDTHSFLKQVP